MTPRLVLALAAVAYVTLVTATSVSPGPRAWGLSLPGYLPTGERALALGLLAVGAGLLLWDARPARPGAASPGRQGPRSGYRGLAFPPWAPLLLLPLLAVAFDALRVRTHLLGDGQVWIDNLVAGSLPAYSEPLSSAIWNGYAWALRTVGVPISASPLAYLPVAAGIAASLLMAALATELATGPGTRRITAVLLLGFGTTQLFFGYIESYPVACVALLAYLLVLERAARGAAPVWQAGALLAAVIAVHVIFVFLVPSYAWLVLRGRVPHWRRALDAAIPVAAVAALFTLLRFGPSDLLRPFSRVAGAAETATADFHFGLTGLLTGRHLVDLMNLALLVAPVPALLLLARVFAGPKAGRRDAPPRTPLVLSAAPGLVVAAVLVVPGSPAQDWDLMAMTVLPGAVLAVALAQPVLAGSSRLGSLGLALLSAGALVSFVLTNANESSAVRRFASLVGPASNLSSHERAYGNEKLVQYHVTRGESETAAAYARRMLDAEPTNPRYWVKAGSVFCNLGRYQEAAPYFEEALRRSPGRADALYNLGICYARTGRGPEALRAFHAAVAADSTRPDYRHNLGVLLYAAGEADSARRVWERLLLRWPGYPLTEQSMAKHFGGGRATSR